MSCDPYAMPTYWVSSQSKTLMNAIDRVGLPIPVTPAPSRASVDVQWVDAKGECSDIYAITDYAYIVRLANAIDGDGRLHYVAYTVGTIGSIQTHLTS